jgi:ribosomal protein S18 acetylase RimI-like enzyme
MRRSNHIGYMKKKENGFIIEKVSDKNFEEFLGLVSKLAEYEKLAPPDADARERLRVDCLSKSPKYEACLGKIGCIYVAYVIYLFTYSSFLALPTLFLEDIFVLKEYRRQGIGQKMFDLCRKKAIQKGCGRIEFIVLDWNKPAQKFYEKNKALRMDWSFYRLNRGDF